MKLFIMILLLISNVAIASDINWDKQDIPKLAKVNGPILYQVILDKWSDLPLKYILFSQATKESCITLTHSKCWNPRVEFKTSREWGIGIPQITITKKFNNFLAARKLDPELANWSLDDRFNTRKQFITMVLMNKNLYLKSIKLTNGNNEAALQFMLSSYNGGFGGLLRDRKLCQSKPDCNPNLWFNNIEKYSYKSKIKAKNYGSSFYDINRKYVRDIWFDKTYLFVN